MKTRARISRKQTGESIPSLKFLDGSGQRGLLDMQALRRSGEMQLFC